MSDTTNLDGREVRLRKADLVTQLRERDTALANLCIEVERLRAENNELRQLCETDLMTGLVRQDFAEREVMKMLQHEARMEKFIEVSVLFVDLDRLKSFNDQFGHAAGDEAIRAIAELLRKSFRADDLLIRFGGDEFLVVMTHTSKKITRQLAEKFRKGVDKSNDSRLNPGALHGTASIGCLHKKVAIAQPVSPETIMNLTKEVMTCIALADEQMREVKLGGRNAVRYLNA